MNFISRYYKSNISDMIIIHEKITNTCKTRKIPMSQVSYLQDFRFESPIIQYLKMEYSRTPFLKLFPFWDWLHKHIHKDSFI